MKRLRYAVRIEMIKHSKKQYFFARERRYIKGICSVNDIDGIITDIELPENIRKNIKA